MRRSLAPRIIYAVRIQSVKMHTEYIQRIQPIYSHIQSIYNPYTAGAYYSIYIPSAGTDGRAEGAPLDYSPSPRGTLEIYGGRLGQITWRCSI